MSGDKFSRQVFSGNSLQESVTFKDAQGADVIPTTLEYRVINRQDNSQIADWTTISSPAAAMTVLFPGTAFETEFPALASEKHEVTLFANRQESGFRASIVYDVEVVRAGVI